MDTFAFKRYPLTATSIAAFAAFTIVSISVRKIRQLFYGSKKRDRSVFLLPDMQNEILYHIVQDATDNELLNMLLTCKEWCDYITNNTPWMDRLRHLHLEKNQMRNEEPMNINVPEEIIAKFGCRDLFSPKITYFLFKRRIMSIYDYGDILAENAGQNGGRPTILSFSEDLKQFKDKGLYTPWLNSNPFKRPEIIWKFLRTALGYIEWLHPLHIIGFKNRAFREDNHTRRRMNGIVALLSVLVSILPTLDNIVYYSREVFTEGWRSPWSIKDLIWMAPKPWSGMAQFNSMLTLGTMQAFEFIFGVAELIFARLLLIPIVVLLSKGLKPLLMAAGCVTVGFLILGGIQRTRFKHKLRHSWIPLIGIPLLYFYPVLAPLVVGALGLFVLMLFAGKYQFIKPQKARARWTLGVSILSLVLPLIMHSIWPDLRM